MCSLRSTGFSHEMHSILECEHLRDLHEARGWFCSMCTMKKVMWQRDMCGVATFVDHFSYAS